MVDRRLTRRADEVRTDLVRLEQKVEQGCQWSQRVQTDVANVEVETAGLRGEQRRMKARMDQMEREMTALLQVNQVMYNVILEMRAAARHNRHNLIVVEEEVVAPPQVRVPEAGGSWEIVGETPPAEEVEEAEEGRGSRASSPEV